MLSWEMKSQRGPASIVPAPVVQQLCYCDMPRTVGVRTFHASHGHVPPLTTHSCPLSAAIAVQLLQERDAELDRADKVLAGLREAASKRDADLAEARRGLAAREAALRDKEARSGGCLASGSEPVQQGANDADARDEAATRRRCSAAGFGAACAASEFTFLAAGHKTPGSSARSAQSAQAHHEGVVAPAAPQGGSPGGPAEAAGGAVRAPGGGCPGGAR